MPTKTETTVHKFNNTTKSMLTFNKDIRNNSVIGLEIIPKMRIDFFKYVCATVAQRPLQTAL